MTTPSSDWPAATSAMCPFKRYEARSRRLAAVHEAGHVVVAWHLDVKLGNAYIWRVDEGTPVERLAWVGGVPFRRLRSQAKALKIGVAGAVAAAIWEGIDDPCDVPFETISQSDWRFAGFSPGAGEWPATPAVYRAVRTTFNWLRRGGVLWPALVFEARMLILEATDRVD